MEHLRGLLNTFLLEINYTQQVGNCFVTYAICRGVKYLNAGAGYLLISLYQGQGPASLSSTIVQCYVLHRGTLLYKPRAPGRDRLNSPGFRQGFFSETGLLAYLMLGR